MQRHKSKVVTDLCKKYGFAQSGVAEASRSVHDVQLTQWLADKKHGEMEWMERNVEIRLDPRALMENARSIVCVADRYGTSESADYGKRLGKVARYAHGRDYHKVMKKRLHAICDILKEQFPEETFRACVDTAPLLEREFAQLAGIGSVGKHTLLIEQGIGSWMLLGAIVTTANFEPSTPSPTDPCSTCTRCIDACPTDAITPWEVDARKCISYLTIEHRSDIDPSFYSQMGDWLFGCDICQEVCPHNQPNERSSLAPIHDLYESQFDAFDVLDVLNWDEDARRAHISGSSMKRAKLGMLRRNAVIVAGNMLAQHQDSELLAKLNEIARDDTEDTLVLTAANEVLGALDS
jgi:epoxyqueuosine reductase